MLFYDLIRLYSTLLLEHSMHSSSFYLQLFWIYFSLVILDYRIWQKILKMFLWEIYMDAIEKQGFFCL